MVTGPDKRVLVSLAPMLSSGLKRVGKRVDFSGIARAAPQGDLEGRQARLPRSAALELLKPWIYERLERAGHVTKIKEAKRMVEQRDPIALAFADELARELPIVLFNVTQLGRASVVSVFSTLWDEPAIGLSVELIAALELHPGDAVVMHVPIDPRAVAEARTLSLDKQVTAPAELPEGWLGKAARVDSPGALLFTSALHGSVDPVKDRRTRLLLGRLDS